MMTCCRLKVAFFLLLNASVPALVAAVEFGSGDHVCNSNDGGGGICHSTHVEIYPSSDFSLDCAENSACRESTIVVGSGSTFTGDFVCGSDDRPSYMSCRSADVTFYDTDVTTYKVGCHKSGEGSSSCRDTMFTLVDTSLEIDCDTGECQDMVVNLCGDSHVLVSGALDSGSPVVINRYGDDATAVVDETGAYSITNFTADQCPVSRFTCDDGCEIVAGFVDDGVCDCSQCEDEAAFNCTTCSGGCPNQCGQRSQCSNFVCGDGCIISDAYVDDGYCECPNCADEPNWDCSTCHCPTCGGSFECFHTTTTTSKPTTTTLKPTTTTSKPMTTTRKPTTTLKPPTTSEMQVSSGNPLTTGEPITTGNPVTTEKPTTVTNTGTTLVTSVLNLNTTTTMPPTTTKDTKGGSGNGFSLPVWVYGIVIVVCLLIATLLLGYYLGKKSVDKNDAKVQSEVVPMAKLDRAEVQLECEDSDESAQQRRDGVTVGGPESGGLLADSDVVSSRELSE